MAGFKRQTSIGLQMRGRNMDKRPFPSKSNNAQSGPEAGKWAKGAMLRLVLIWLRFTVELLMIIALGFVIVSWSSFRELTPDKAMVLHPQVIDHDKTNSALTIRTLDIDNSFPVVATQNTIYLDLEAQRVALDPHPGNQPFSAVAVSRSYEPSLTIPLIGLLLLAVLVLLVIISIRAGDYVYLREFWIAHLTFLRPKRPMDS
jgi:hypothetical protein